MAYRPDRCVRNPTPHFGRPTAAPESPNLRSATAHAQPAPTSESVGSFSLRRVTRSCRSGRHANRRLSWMLYSRCITSIPSRHAPRSGAGAAEPLPALAAVNENHSGTGNDATLSVSSQGTRPPTGFSRRPARGVPGSTPARRSGPPSWGLGLAPSKAPSARVVSPPSLRPRR